MKNLLIGLIVSVSFAANSASLEGQSFKDKVSFNKKELVLNEKDIVEALTKASESFKEESAKLLAMIPNVKKGEEISFGFNKNELHVFSKNKLAGIIKKKNDPKEILSIYIGANPPNKELKNGILGL